jgi:hypothetical protein
MAMLPGRALTFHLQSRSTESSAYEAPHLHTVWMHDVVPDFCVSEFLSCLCRR